MPLPFGDIGGPILAAFGGNVTLQRHAAGTRVNGDWVPGALTSSTLSAAVQPAGPRDLLKLPEGERTEEAIVLFTQQALIASEVPGQLESDRIVYAGRTYRVRAVEDWTAQAQYAYAIATRVSE